MAQARGELSKVFLDLGHDLALGNVWLQNKPSRKERKKCEAETIENTKHGTY